MNHPDKVEVPGSGMKNRYRTIIPSKWKIWWFVRLVIRCDKFCLQYDNYFLTVVHELENVLEGLLFNAKLQDRFSLNKEEQ